MGKILRQTDRIKVSIGKSIFTLAPLTQLQKIEISECTKIEKGGDEVLDIARAQALLVKYSLKDIEGIEDYEGNEYSLEMENDSLTDECVAEIFTLEEKSSFLIAAWQCMNGFPGKITNPATGKPLKGVALEILSKKKPSG
jgi:hypothetical protein